MICKRCGGEIDTRRRRADGSLQCSRCNTVYRPAKTSSPKIIPSQRKHKKRWIVIAIILGLALLIAINTNQTNNDISEIGNTVQNNDVQATNIVISEEKAAKPLTQSDWEIINMDGHPRYGDSVELSHTIWDNVENGKILFADSFNKYEKTNIITMDDVTSKGTISDIEVYFCNSQTIPPMTLEEALPVISSYIPIDSMRGKYSCTESFIALPKEGTKGEKHHFIEYIITEEARLANPEMFYDLIVEIQFSENQVSMFRVVNSMPNWTMRLEFNGYYSEPWDYDFLA